MRSASRTASGAKTFVDTNFLLYAIDRFEPGKRVRAQKVMREPVSADEAASAIESMSRLPIVPLDLALVREGIAISRSTRISLWDGLIVAAAIAGGCTRLITEDLQDGQRIGTVIVENPFRELG